MLSASTCFFPLRAEREGLCFDLVPNPNLDFKTYMVKVVVEDQLFTCACTAFEMCGLICPHIIRVMVHLNVQQILERYMLHRWSTAATTPAPAPGTNGVRFGVPGTNTMKYNALRQKMNDLALDACIVADTYKVVLVMIDEANKVVVATRIAQSAAQQEENEDVGPPAKNDNQPSEQTNVTQQEQQKEGQPPPSSSNLRIPARVKPKGCPSEKEKRLKPLIELREEANKRRKTKAAESKTGKAEVDKTKRKTRAKNCLYCNDEGHTVKECKYMLAALQMKADRVVDVIKIVLYHWCIFLLHIHVLEPYSNN
jgi:hypothetical protein